MCYSCATRVSQEHLIVKGFLSIFLRENAKKPKFPVPKSFHKRNKFIQDTVNLLRPCCSSPFSGLFRHTLRVAFYFSTLFLHFSVCLLAYTHISKCSRLLCALFRSTSLPQPFSGLEPAFGLYFLQQKTAQAAFSGPSVLCRIRYIKRRAAPKSRPPTIQAML